MIQTSSLISTTDIKLGAHIKATVAGSLDTITHGVNAVSDTLINVRKTNEVIYTSLSNLVLDDKLEYATKLANGITSLTEAGMTKEEAISYLEG